MAGRRQHGEGSLYQRSSDGRWIASIPDGWSGGKRKRRVFTGVTPDIARARRDAYLARKRDGFTMPKGRQPYVDEWMRHWLKNVAAARVEATTWHNSYRQKVEELICPYFERVPLPELDEEMIEAWHRKLEGRVSARTHRPLSASTIGQAHRIMSAALKVAVVRGKMPRNPCSNMTPPRVTRAEVQPPAEDEARAVLARCQTWPNGARWILAMTTGLRQGEALALEWRDVRLEDPASVRVRVSAARANHERIVKAPKSEKSRRSVPLVPLAVEALRRHRAHSVRAIDGLVFLSVRGQPVHPRVDYGDWHALLDDLGLPHYRVHDLRHAAATYLLEEGVDIKVVSEILGHASTAFTQQRYQHVTPRLHQSAADAMDRITRR
jgi:integrase